MNWSSRMGISPLPASPNALSGLTGWVCLSYLMRFWRYSHWINTPKNLWDEYRTIVKNHETSFTEFEFVERFLFYERAKKAYAVLASSEPALYANIILKKGVIKA
jgi:hypothetical protein